MYDTIVIGNGPAGISGAIYLKRFNYNVLVIGKDLGALEGNHYIDNYYGLKHIKGSDLINAGIDQAKDLGVDVLKDEVVAIEYASNGFVVKTIENTYECKTIFLTAGKPRTKLSITNLKEYEGKGISYCAICDGFFFRNKKIGIVGNSFYMKNELEVLKKFSTDITVFTNGLECDLNDGTKIVNEKIVSFTGNSEKLTGLETSSNHYDLDACFIAIGSANATSFAKHLGLQIDEKDNIVVKDFMTNIPGIFAGGDIIGGLAQVSKAVCDGALASMEIKKYLTKLK